MAVAGQVHMVGLKEFTRDLRRVDKEFPRQVARAMRKAAKHVEGDARSRYARRYRQGASGRSTRSVKGIAAFASSWEAGIKFGDDRRPWLIGQEFGSNRYQQFRPWTGAGPGGKGSHGRFIWPAIREEMDTVSDQLADDLMGILRGATA